MSIYARFTLVIGSTVRLVHKWQKCKQRHLLGPLPMKQHLTVHEWQKCKTKPPLSARSIDTRPWRAMAKVQNKATSHQSKSTKQQCL
jgi:hypothetical protein